MHLLTIRIDGDKLKNHIRAEDYAEENCALVAFVYVWAHPEHTIYIY